MEHLPQTKGKGVLMFAKRQQRMDELSAEQYEMKRKEIPVDAFVEPEGETVKPPPQEESTQAPQDIYVRQQQQYQDQPFQQQMLPQSANCMNGLYPYQGSAFPDPLSPTLLSPFPFWVVIIKDKKLFHQSAASQAQHLGNLKTYSKFLFQ